MNDKDYRSCAFYVQAHQDDWQFFFGEKVCNDLRTPSSKVVFIYTTAGDGDPGVPGYQEKGWWESRAFGALASILRATQSAEEVEAQIDALPEKPFVTDKVICNERSIIRRSWANTVSYCMRIPSGPTPEKLHQGTPTESMGGQASYKTWDDFGKTLRAIIDAETPEHLKDPSAEYRPWIAVSDDDNVGRNPEDHPDHHETSLAIKEFVAPLGLYRFALYATYYTGEIPPQFGDPLTPEQFAVKKAMYDAYRDTFGKKLAGYGGDPALLQPYFDNEWSHYGPRSAQWRNAPEDWGVPVVVGP